MSKQGTVAVYIRSESGDGYLYCFENQSVEDIEIQLMENMEMFYPICEVVTDGSNEDFVSDVDIMLGRVYDASWDHAEDY